MNAAPDPAFVRASGSDPAPTIPLCLQRLRDGDRGAADAMLPLVCEQLRALAGRLMRGDRPGRTLPPTALVHEAWFQVALEALAPGSRSMAIPNHTVFLGYPRKGAERGDGTGLQHLRLRHLERLVDDGRQPTVVRRRRS